MPALRRNQRVPNGRASKRIKRISVKENISDEIRKKDSQGGNGENYTMQGALAPAHAIFPNVLPKDQKYRGRNQRKSQIFAAGRKAGECPGQSQTPPLRIEQDHHQDKRRKESEETP